MFYNAFVFVFGIISCVFILKQLFAEGEVIIGECSPQLRLGEYSPIITLNTLSTLFRLSQYVLNIYLSVVYPNPQAFVVLNEFEKARGDLEKVSRISVKFVVWPS